VILESIVAAVIAAASPEAPGWKDVAPPEGLERPALARIFDLEGKEAAAVAEITAKLFGDEVRAAVAGDRLVVVGPPKTVEFLTVILKEVAGRHRVGGEAGSGADLRAAVVGALGGLSYSRLPATVVTRTPSGSAMAQQSIDLQNADLDAIFGFVERVTKGLPGVEVIRAAISARTRGGGGDWFASIEFAAAGAGPVEAGGARPDLLRLYTDFRKTLDGAGVPAGVKSFDFQISRSGARPEPPPLTVSISVPSTEDSLRLERAFVAPGAPFDAAASSISKGKEVVVILSLRPRAGPRT
jgi:hypothetical protein